MRWPWRKAASTPSPGRTKLRPGDERFIDGAQALHARDGLGASSAAVLLMVAALGAALAWAAFTEVDQVTRAEATVVPDGREQVISHLEGGILLDLPVREGALVQAGQVLLQLDPTRFLAQKSESETKARALRAAIARLAAEAAGRQPVFPPELKDAPEVTEPEMEAFTARQLSLQDAVGTTRRGMALVQAELDMAQAMAAKGLLSMVEVIRLQRQMNDMRLTVQERTNRHRQDASSELVKVRNELAQLEEQAVVREDALTRAVLRSPVQGVVKNIRIGTRGSVVQAGAPIMEIVPLGPKVLIEARVKPGDVGFVRVGQRANVKLATYEYQTYGGLQGVVEMLSPDTLRDPARGSPGDYYKALVRSDRSTLHAAGQSLPVIPGMTATVEIHAGKRSVLSLLLRPMMKFREAFSER
jgi:membrane fusion protein, adhesin transport system